MNSKLKCGVKNMKNDIYEGFIRTKGQILVDEDDKQYLVRGMAFGNGVWGNPALPPKNHHTKESYAMLAETGFNNIRFYLNYGIFEDDAKPYFYKQSGWDWIDKNIEWAKKYGIRLILNMHYPQGGFQSNGNGTALWTVRENQERLTALWKEIALRYKDEPVVMGYDFINEPIVPKMATVEESFAQWIDLAERIRKAVREVNESQIIFVERLNAVKDMATGAENWDINQNGRMNYISVDDDNIVYEFHMYEPFDITHQNASWVNAMVGRFAAYPDDARGFNKQGLENSIEKYLAFGKERNVPLYLGEFGAIVYSFLENRGGRYWVRDMLEICGSKNINFNYHTFHENNFGLYLNPAHIKPDDLNTELHEEFKSALSKLLQ